MIKRVHHIGIAVKSLKESVPLFENLLGVKPRLEEAPSQKVNEAVFRIGDGMEIDLIEPTGLDSTIAKFLENRGEGLHHVALEVDDIGEELKVMEKKGFRIIGDISGEGVAGQTGFLHPKSVNGVLVELVQPREGGE